MVIHNKTSMLEHQRRTILKAALMAVDPHCSACGCELVARYGADNSAVLVGDKLKCTHRVVPDMRDVVQAFHSLSAGASVAECNVNQ